MRLSTKHKIGLGLGASAIAMTAGLGAVGMAQAEPTPSPSTGTSAPSASPSQGGTTAPGQGSSEERGPRGHGPKGGLPGASASQLAEKLGVDEAKVTEALKAIAEEQRASGTKPDTDPAARQAALAKALASKLGVDEAKVTEALQAIAAEHQAEEKAELQAKLDAAVKAGTLTQAEADAVMKAAEAGVINYGGKGR